MRTAQRGDANADSDQPRSARWRQASRALRVRTRALLGIPLGLDLDTPGGYACFVDGGSGFNGVTARANLDRTKATANRRPESRHQSSRTFSVPA